ncbi:MAG: methyltransferase, partial [Bacteroidota bacterium]
MMETRPEHADALLSLLGSRYDIELEELTIGGKPFSLHRVRDTNALLDTIDPELPDADERLPYWAELWTAAPALAEWCMASRYVPGASVLELGCGLGLPGIAAATAGGRVTMTDYNEDALQFARLNVLVNLHGEERANVVIAFLDWRAPFFRSRFDVILGADIIYDRKQFPALLGLFRIA